MSSINGVFESMEKNRKKNRTDSLEPTDDILDRLADLHKQATTERSHFYVARCCKDAIIEIIKLRERVQIFVVKEIEIDDLLKERNELKKKS